MQLQEIMNQVSGGATLRVDLPSRTAKLNGRTIAVEPSSNIDVSLPCILNILAECFNQYKHSRPTQRSEQDRTPYFRALPLGELTDEDMNFGEPRDIAKARLELLILNYLIANILTWDETVMGKGWFYAHPLHRDFILRRSWIERTND